MKQTCAEVARQILGVRRWVAEWLLLGQEIATLLSSRSGATRVLSVPICVAFSTRWTGVEVVVAGSVREVNRSAEWQSRERWGELAIHLNRETAGRGKPLQAARNPKQTHWEPVISGPTHNVTLWWLACWRHVSATLMSYGIVIKWARNWRVGAVVQEVGGCARPFSQFCPNQPATKLLHNIFIRMHSYN